MKRLIRFDDAYLAHFDVYGTPCWVPRSEARNFLTKTMARNALKKARAYHGKDSDIRIVLVGAPETAPRRETAFPAVPAYPNPSSLTKEELTARICGLLDKVWAHFDPTGSESNDCFAATIPPRRTFGFSRQGRRCSGLSCLWTAR